MASVDAVIIGRKTYDAVLKFVEWPYGSTPVFVLSHHSIAQGPPGAIVERLEGDPGSVLSQVGTRGMRHAYVDGGVTIQGFLRAGLIQRLIITWVPVLIGDGLSLFGALPRDVRLRHVATRSFSSGLVQSEYHVDPGTGQPALPKLW